MCAKGRKQADCRPASEIAGCCRPAMSRRMQSSWRTCPEADTPAGAVFNASRLRQLSAPANCVSCFQFLASSSAAAQYCGVGRAATASLFLIATASPLKPASRNHTKACWSCLGHDIAVGIILGSVRSGAAWPKRASGARCGSRAPGKSRPACRRSLHPRSMVLARQLSRLDCLRDERASDWCAATNSEP